MGLQGAFFGLCGRELIDQAVGLLDGEKIRVEIKEGLELDGFLFILQIGEDAFKDIGAVVGPHVDSYGDVLDVGKETVALDKAHVWGECWVIILFGYERNLWQKKRY